MGNEEADQILVFADRILRKRTGIPQPQIVCAWYPVLVKNAVDVCGKML
jgi:hypothetical protein